MLSLVCHPLRVFACFLAFAIFANVNLPANATTLPEVLNGKSAAEYLPTSTQYNPDILTPEAYLGYQMGKWHVRHDQLLGYMRYLAGVSDRLSIANIGKTHEERQLVWLTITSPQNHVNIEAIRQAHIESINKGNSTNDAPLVIFMGYGVHGNESSTSNAAMLLAYYLAAGNDQRIDALLENAVILLDPVLNPDGFSRFANWANMHRGLTPSASPFHREHNEPWPSGRTNHYWFDLNRDWLLLTHPESQARVAQFQRWRPHVHTDFHEMGPNNTYFFQPGIASRKNPLTPETNVTLTKLLAGYHAKALDKQGVLYYTEELFDDFYYGKGSTYPDAHGSIGILFEQASSRGHVQDTINGTLTFAQTIQNQITTSLSTFDGALANKAALIEYQTNFVSNALRLSKDDDVTGVVIARGNDHGRFDAMLDILAQHQIQFSVLTKTIRIEKATFKASNAVFVPYNQPQYRLIKSLFSTQTSFADNTFYDVSNWNLPLAFDLTYAKLSSRQARQLSVTPEHTALSPPEQAEKHNDAIAYAFDWHHYFAPALAQKLLQDGWQLRAANRAFKAQSADSTREFAQGSMVILQTLNKGKDISHALEAASTWQIPLFPISSGLTSQGIDLGSRNLVPVKQPKVLIIGGEGTSQYEVGEIWHYLDTRIGIPTVIVEQSKLSSVVLANFTHIVATSSAYKAISDPTISNLSQWLHDGGTLIGQKRALQWFKRNKWLNIEFVKKGKINGLFSKEGLTFADKTALAAKKRIAGATFLADVDVTHPLFFGLADTKLPLFKTSNMIVENTFSPFDTLATYSENSLQGGYAAPELVEHISESLAVVVQPKGKGRVIGFVDNVNFRGYWYGSSKLMGNALFLSELMN